MINIEAIKREHAAVGHHPNPPCSKWIHCPTCKVSWPCDAYKLAEECERLRAHTPSACQDADKTIARLEAELARTREERDEINRDLRAHVGAVHFGHRWICNKCGHTDPVEKEVLCWSCGKGEMLYESIEDIRAERDSAREALKAADSVLGKLREDLCYCAPELLGSRFRGRGERIVAAFDTCRAALSRLSEEEK